MTLHKVPREYGMGSDGHHHISPNAADEKGDVLLYTERVNIQFVKFDLP